MMDHQDTGETSDPLANLTTCSRIDPAEPVYRALRVVLIGASPQICAVQVSRIMWGLGV